MHLARTILQAICAAMAVLAGFFAAVVALLGIGVVLLLRLFGRAPARPAGAPARSRSWLRRDGAIDVTATEVNDPESEPRAPSP